HPPVSNRAAGALEKARRTQHRKDERCSKECLAVAFLVEAAKARREQPVERTGLLAVLLIKALEVEAQIALPDTPDGQLKRLGSLAHGPARPQRRETLEHMVLEVVDIHRRLLAHCRCNEVPMAGLQPDRRRPHAG